jgi:hypothetical protein
LFYFIFVKNNNLHADTAGRAAYGVGLKPVDSWDHEFESRGCMDVRLLRLI